MENMKVEILSRDFVKPSSPTPNHLRDYKLCLLDQFHPEFHGGIIFFYASPTKNSIDHINTNRSLTLKKSLSEALTEFYPIAGRFKDTSTIDCNDAGACFVEAKSDSDLSGFLAGLNAARDVHKSLGKLVPSLDSATMELASESMMIAQLTEFECGGFAISLCLQHRFCDFSSVVTFVRRWSAAAAQSKPSQTEQISPPDFSAASSLFPPKADMAPTPAMANPIGDRTTARLVFEAAKIAELKSGKSLSSVEAVLALILKSAISAARSPPSPSVLLHAVNLRRRTTPPLPDTAMGNLYWMIPVKIESNRTDFTQIAAEIRRETAAFFDGTVERLCGDRETIFEAVRERVEIVRSLREADLYLCSSWCRFALYGVDFGWGAPVWVSSGVAVARNLIVLEDTKCGTGIQAWVTLDPQVMAVFERDQDLLSFASLASNAHDLVY